MVTAEEVKAQFLADLQALLDKYGAELEAKDYWNGYPECGEDVRMTVYIDGKYSDGEVLQEWTEIDLGSWRCAQKS